MRIYKRRRSNNGGEVKTSNKHYIEFNDACGVRRSLLAFSNREATAEMGRNIQRLVELRLSGIQPNNGLMKFIESLPKATRDSLVKWGILDHQFGEMGNKPAKHLEDWKIELEAKGNSKKHVKEFVAKVERLFRHCDWERLSDIKSIDFNQWVASAKKENMSAATINHYMTSIKIFCSWLVREKRIAESQWSI